MANAGGVKGLVGTGSTSVPESLLVAADDDDVPVVDFSEIVTQRQQVLDQVQHACTEWGFFQLVGHGVPVDLMDDMDELVHAFHNLPAQEKMLYYSTDMSKAITLLDLKLNWCHDMLVHMHTTPGPPRDDEMPKNLPYYKRVTSEYGKQVESLAKQLLGVLSESLGLEPEALEKRLGTPRHVMRMTYYPRCPNPASAAIVGLDAHSDPGGLTILQQGTGIEGLQVLKRGRWVPVKPRHGAFVINMGDQIQILTNDKYKSVEHRVVANTEFRPRISIASFYNPGADAFIDPMVELLGDDPPVFTGCKFGEYISSFMSKELENKTVFVRYKTQQLT